MNKRLCKSGGISTKVSVSARGGPKPNATRLTEEAKNFVVEALVCRQSPEAVQARLQEEFSIAVSLNAVRAFDPTLGMGRVPAKRWHDRFHRSRSALDKGLKEVRSPKPGIQLRGLIKIMRRARAARDDVGVAECEQAFSKIFRSYRESIFKKAGIEWPLREGGHEDDLHEEQTGSTAVRSASSPS